MLGKLWGSGKGKFRTNGKYSSATVRGTIWLVEDRCEGTLTKVTRGTVSVRDFKRKKTVTVKAGHSYLARAQRAASKSKRLTALLRCADAAWRVACEPWGRHARTRDAGPAVGRRAAARAWRSARSRRAGRARDGAIDGTPLNVAANDTGLFQVASTAAPSGEFLARPNGVAYAGLSAALTVSASNGELHRVRRHGRQSVPGNPRVAADAHRRRRPRRSVRRDLGLRRLRRDDCGSST